MLIPTSTDVIFIGGPSGVGKSSVAAEASRILAGRDVSHAVIEGDNLDQAYPEPWRAGVNLAEQNLAAIWANYRTVGYSRLIFTNTVSVLQLPELVAAIGGDVRAFAALLTASDETTASRLSRREIGSALQEHIERSKASAAHLEAHSSAHRIPTDGRPVAHIAHELLSAAGWLRRD